MKTQKVKTFAVKFRNEKGFMTEKLVGATSQQEAINSFNSWFPDVPAISARLCSASDKGKFFRGLASL